MAHSGATPELRVVDDVAAAGLDIFLEVRPRTIQLSGGSTPRALYELMAGVTDYPWTEVEAFFGDERCLPAGDDRSAGRQPWRRSCRVPARTYPINGATCDADGYEQVLRERFGDDLSFDLAVYRLGGRTTASLFPAVPRSRSVTGGSSTCSRRGGSRSFHACRSRFWRYRRPPSD